MSQTLSHWATSPPTLAGSKELCADRNKTSEGTTRKHKYKSVLSSLIHWKNDRKANKRRFHLTSVRVPGVFKRMALRSIVPRCRKLSLKRPIPVTCSVGITIRHETQVLGVGCCNAPGPVDETRRCVEAQSKVISPLPQNDGKCSTGTRVYCSAKLTTGASKPIVIKSKAMWNEGSKRDMLLVNEGMPLKIESVYSLAGQENDFGENSDPYMVSAPQDDYSQPLDFTKSSKLLQEVDRKLKYGKQSPQFDLGFAASPISEENLTCSGGDCDVKTVLSQWSDEEVFEPLDFSKNGTFETMNKHQEKQSGVLPLTVNKNASRKTTPKMATDVKNNVDTWQLCQPVSIRPGSLKVVLRRSSNSEKSVSPNPSIQTVGNTIGTRSDKNPVPHSKDLIQERKKFPNEASNSTPLTGCSQINTVSLTEMGGEYTIAANQDTFVAIKAEIGNSNGGKKATTTQCFTSFSHRNQAPTVETWTGIMGNAPSRPNGKTVPINKQADRDVYAASRSNETVSSSLTVSSNKRSSDSETGVLYVSKICRPWVDEGDDDEDAPSNFSIICGDFNASDDEEARLLTPVVKPKGETAFNVNGGYDESQTFRLPSACELTGPDFPSLQSNCKKGHDLHSMGKVKFQDQIPVGHRAASFMRKTSTGSEDSGVDMGGVIVNANGDDIDKDGELGGNLVIDIPDVEYKQINYAARYPTHTNIDTNSLVKKRPTGEDQILGPDTENYKEINRECTNSDKKTNCLNVEQQRVKSAHAFRVDLQGKYSRQTVPRRPMSPLKRRWIRQHMAQDRRNSLESNRRRGYTDGNSYSPRDGARSPRSGARSPFRASHHSEPGKRSLENSVGETRMGIISALNELNQIETEHELDSKSQIENKTASNQEFGCSGVSSNGTGHYAFSIVNEMQSTMETIPSTVRTVNEPTAANEPQIRHQNTINENHSSASKRLNLYGVMTGYERVERKNGTGKFRDGKHINIRGYYRSLTDSTRMKYPAVYPHNQCSHSDNTKLQQHSVSCASPYRKNNRFRVSSVCARDMADWQATTSIGSRLPRKTRKLTEPCWGKKLTTMPRRSTRLDNDPYVHYLNRLDKERVSDKSVTLTYAKQTIVNWSSVGAEQFVGNTMEERVATVGCSGIESFTNGGHLTSKEPSKTFGDEPSLDGIHSASAINIVHDSGTIEFIKGSILTEPRTGDLVPACTEGKPVHNGGECMTVGIAEQNASPCTESIGELNGNTANGVIGVEENCSTVTLENCIAVVLSDSNEPEQPAVPIGAVTETVDTVSVTTNFNDNDPITVQTFTEIDLVTDCGAFETVEEDSAAVPIAEPSFGEEDRPEGASNGPFERIIYEENSVDNDISVPEICNLENDYVALDIEIPHSPVAEVVCESAVADDAKSDGDSDIDKATGSRSPNSLSECEGPKEVACTDEKKEIDEIRGASDIKEIVEENESAGKGEIVECGSGIPEEKDTNNSKEEVENISHSALENENESVDTVESVVSECKDIEVRENQNETNASAVDTSGVTESLDEVVIETSLRQAVEIVGETVVTECETLVTECINEVREETETSEREEPIKDSLCDEDTVATTNNELYYTSDQGIEEFDEDRISCSDSKGTDTEGGLSGSCSAESEINLASFGVKDSSVYLSDVSGYLNGRASVNIRRRPWRNMGKSKLGMIITESNSSDSDDGSPGPSKEAALDDKGRPVRMRKKSKGCGHHACQTCDSYDESRVRALINAIKRFEQAFFGEKPAEENVELSKDILDSLLISGKDGSKRSRQDSARCSSTESFHVGDKIKSRKGKKRKRSGSRGSSMKRMKGSTAIDSKHKSKTLDLGHRVRKTDHDRKYDYRQKSDKAYLEMTSKSGKTDPDYKPRKTDLEQKSRKGDFEFKSRKRESAHKSRKSHSDHKSKRRDGEHRSKKKHKRKKEHKKTNNKEGRVEKKRLPKLSTQVPDMYDFKSGSSGGDSTPSSERNIFESIQSIKSHSSSSSHNVESNRQQSGGKERKDSGSKEKIQPGNRDKTQSIGKEKTQSFGKDMMQSSGRDKTQSIGKEKTQSFGKDMMQSSGKDKTQSIGKSKMQSSGRDKTQPNGKDKTPPNGKDKTPKREDRQAKESSRIQSPQEERVYKLKELLRAQQKALEDIRLKSNHPVTV